MQLMDRQEPARVLSRNWWPRNCLLFMWIQELCSGRWLTIFFEPGKDPSDAEMVTEECEKISISIEYKDGAQHIFLDGTDVSTEIRQEEVGKNASVVAKNQAVRNRLLALQRQMAEKQDVIMDGRDIGTVVLPDAQVKIYLTASASVRAERRYKELVEKGETCNLKKD